MQSIREKLKSMTIEEKAGQLIIGQAEGEKITSDFEKTIFTKTHICLSYLCYTIYRQKRYD